MRTLIAAGHVQTAEREILEGEKAAAERLYKSRPFDQGAEIAYEMAVEALIRHDARNAEARPT